MDYLAKAILSRPNAKHVLSPADRDLLDQYGAAVVECSWVRVKEVPWSRIGGKCERLRTYQRSFSRHKYT